MAKAKSKRTARQKAAPKTTWKPSRKVDTTRAPEWWLSRPDEVRAYLESLRGVDVFEIGTSAGGRPIFGATWGKKEELPGRTSTSLASAIAGGDPCAFYGKGERKRQSRVFIGAAHGTEIEGTVAALNLLSVTVTGKDLRGKRRPKLAAEGRKLRIVVIPFQNIDGRERYREHVQFVGCDLELYRSISQGNWKTGQKLTWPASKLTLPIPPSEVKNMGSYYNDNGVNLVYDSPLSGQCQPETTALLRFCRDEMPDCVVFSHSNNGSLVEPPSAFIPEHFRQRQMHVASLAGMRCHKEGMKKSNVPTRTQSYAGEQFYQTDMIYHNCGALPLLVEFPCGYMNLPDSLDEILEIGLLVLEEIAAFGNRYRFRPPDPKWR